MIEDGDSDEEDLASSPIQQALDFIQQIEDKNQELKDRRNNGKIIDPLQTQRETINNRLQQESSKALGEFVGVVKEVNRMREGDKGENMLL